MSYEYNPLLRYGFDKVGTGGGGSEGDMLKSVYDPNNDGIVSNANNSLYLNNFPYSFFLMRANHQGAQSASTISDLEAVVGTYNVASANNATNLGGQAGSYYLNRSNHTGTQLASTISDLSTTVAGLAALSATTANNSSLLNNQSGSYYLSRTNHTGTQLSNTISDFNTAVQALINTTVGTIPGKLILTGAITPPTITVNPTNDYNPTGLSNANVIFLSATTNVDLTGLQAQENGRVLFLQNFGPNSVKLKNNNVGSIAANRFDLRADATLQEGNGGIIIYNTAIARWVLVAIY